MEGTKLNADKILVAYFIQKGKETSGSKKIAEQVVAALKGDGKDATEFRSEERPDPTLVPAESHTLRKFPSGACCRQGFWYPPPSLSLFPGILLPVPELIRLLCTTLWKFYFVSLSCDAILYLFLVFSVPVLQNKYFWLFLIQNVSM